MASVIVYLRDYGAQLVSTGIPVQSIATTGELQAVVDAIQVWSRGQDDGADILSELEARVGVGSNDPDAQSGVYAYIVMKDNITGKSYKERLPMPDTGKAADVSLNPAWLSRNDSAGNSVTYMNPVHVDYAAFKTALEDAYVSPEGNTAVLVDVYIPNRL